LGWANEKIPPGLRKSDQANEYVWEKDGSIMVYVRGGEFMMGRDWIIPNEKPVHTVRVDPFYIDKYEVTRSAFKKFVASTAYKTTAEQLGNGGVIRPQGVEQAAAGKSWRDPGFPQDDMHPVVMVSWNDAKAYAAWDGKSLPSEAQWEKAASWDDAAVGAKRKRVYCWGDTDVVGPGAGSATILKRGNFADVTFGEEIPDVNPPIPLKTLLTDDHWGGGYNDGYVYTAPVGKFERGQSPSGAFDMSGNVWEWCEDGYDADFYSRSPKDNPVNGDGKNGRVARGSAYDTPSTSVYPSAFRLFLPADARLSTVGFRLVVPASAP
jgi:sulfatase modifying factor 1